MAHPLTLPFGLPGQGLSLTVDPLAVLFLCMLAPQTIATALTEVRSASFWLFTGAIALTLLAADAFTLILGFQLTAAILWRQSLKPHAAAANAAASQAAAGQAAIGAVCGACLIPAVFLPPGGLAFALILLAAAAAAGLAPLSPATVSSTTALMTTARAKLALYLIIRYGFVVLAGNMALWWGIALIVAGAACALAGAIRAALLPDLGRILAGAVILHTGLTAIGLGIALTALAGQNPALAALALQAAMLCAIAHSLFQPLLILGAGAIETATGTMSLDWLGGLIRGMPKLGLLILFGATGLAAMPLGPGFAPEFLLLHATLAAAAGPDVPTRLGGFALVALLTVLALVAALALAAALRIVGIGLLGRPRSLRAAAATDPGATTIIAMAGLAACALPLALTPGLVLAALRPVIAQLAPGAPQPVLAYTPLPLALLVAAIATAAWLALRKFGVPATRDVPGWTGGLGKPPPWLPFGDPLTQPTATGFAQPIRHAIRRAIGDRWPTFGQPRLPKPRRLTIRLSPDTSASLPLAAILGVFVLLLLAFVLARPG